jgi:predicted dehydrogenase
MRKTTAVLVGCGHIADAWLNSETVKRKVNIVGLVDIDPWAANAKRARFGLDAAVTGTDLEAVLRQTGPEAVFDCTVPEAHGPVTLAALKRGCHVMGEKPMSDAMTVARRMAAAARKAGRTYAVMQNRRYLKGIRALRRFLDGGAIGRLVAVHGDFFIGAHFGGFRDVMAHVLLLDMAIHSFDQARFITGADARHVYAHEWTPRHSWYRHGPSASAIFEMTDGLVYTYQGSWCAEGCPTTWECAWRLVGERGTILWDGNADFRCEVVAGDQGFMRAVKSRKVPVACPKSLGGGHDSALACFLEAIHKGTVPETDSSDNIRSLAMVHAAVKSAETGKRVAVTA